MALTNFIVANSYTRINQIVINKETSCIFFEIKVYESAEGELLYGPLYFSIDQAEEITEYKEQNLVLPDAPEYPVLCSAREALTPMWTAEGTQEEIAYNAAKAVYEQEVIDYEIACDTATQAMETEAETENKYDSYFSDQKIYTDSNATACAYTYLKTLSGFEGVEDA